MRKLVLILIILISFYFLLDKKENAFSNSKNEFVSLKNTKNESLIKKDKVIKVETSKITEDPVSENKGWWVKEFVLCKTDIKLECQISQKRTQMSLNSKWDKIFDKADKIWNLSYIIPTYEDHEDQQLIFKEDDENYKDNLNDQKSSNITEEDQNTDEFHYCLETRNSCVSEDFVFPLSEDDLLEYFNSSEVALYFEDFSKYEDKPFNFYETKERLAIKEKYYKENKEENHE